jgi:glycerol uptake facilitator-like aquaporin
MNLFVCLFLEFIGAFIAGALVFGTYYDAINRFDGGVRQVRRVFFCDKTKH